MAFSYAFRTDKDSQFTGALAQNAIAQVDVVLPGALAGVNGNARSRLQSIVILSDQNLAWEIMLFTKSTGPNSTDMDLDTFLGRWTFLTTDAVQIAGTGNYYYYIDGLNVAYTDADNSGKIHLGLINRSVTSKNAGATGEIVVQLMLEPMVTP